MQFFEINGKEYELKMNFKAVKHLNSLHKGGAMEVIGKAMLQDLDLFVQVVHAALIHTGEGIKFKDVQDRVEDMFNEEKLDADTIQSTLNSLVTDHFFYKAMVEKLKKQDKKMEAALGILNS